MRRPLASAAIISAVALAGFAVAPAANAQIPTRDSVKGVGFTDFFPPNQYRSASVDAASGPSGESPSGTVSINLFCGSGPPIVGCFPGGAVTCLKVTGNRAVVGYFGRLTVAGSPQSHFRERGLIEIVDNGPPGPARDAMQIAESNVFFSSSFPIPDPALDVPITDCPETVPGPETPLLTDQRFTSDFVVTDAQPPLPTSKDQCKKGGWQTYGIFKNQGDCVSFVATGGKNPPARSKKP